VIIAKDRCQNHGPSRRFRSLTDAPFPGRHELVDGGHLRAEAEILEVSPIDSDFLSVVEARKARANGVPIRMMTACRGAPGS